MTIGGCLDHVAYRRLYDCPHGARAVGFTFRTFYSVSSITTLGAMLAPSSSSAMNEFTKRASSVQDPTLISENRVCPGCRNSVVNESGGVVVAFGYVYAILALHFLRLITRTLANLSFTSTASNAPNVAIRLPQTPTSSCSQMDLPYAQIVPIHATSANCPF